MHFILSQDVLTEAIITLIKTEISRLDSYELFQFYHQLLHALFSNTNVLRNEVL